MVAKKLLMVDDDQDLLNELAESFRLEGYEVLQAHDGVEALFLLQTIKVDVIITDMTMKGMSGYKLIGALADSPSLCTVPTVVFSGRSEQWHGIKVPNVTYFLQKPSSMATLRAVVGKVSGKTVGSKHAEGSFY